MRHLLYLMFRCDFDVTESLESLEELNTAINYSMDEASFCSALRASVCLLSVDLRRTFNLKICTSILFVPIRNIRSATGTGSTTLHAAAEPQRPEASH